MKTRSLAPILLALAALSIPARALAQEHVHPSPTPTPAPMAAPETDDDPDPMARMERMEPGDGWMTMLHGYAFLTANRQGGPSGDRDFGSQNHLMAMAIRRLWGGKLSLLGTFTLEPATIPPRGSAELFQRGETYQGILLVDRQHPHDLFVQLAAAWERALGPVDARLSVAIVGEPAIGPSGYPHRLSASENPIAPLAHHNQDSTHITYDVVTLGLKGWGVTLEGSLFHGAEPDENRWDLEAGALDSYSGRLTVDVTDALSLQVSAAHLTKPEALEEGDQTRTTGSIVYRKALPGGFLAAMLSVGKNQTHDGPEWGSLLEFTWKFAEKNFLFGRVERVDRDVYELLNKRQRDHDIPHERTHVDAATLGFTRNVGLFSEAETGVGAAVTLYRFDDRLDAVYGSSPVSVHGFFRIRFGAHGGGAEGAGHAHH